MAVEAVDEAVKELRRADWLGQAAGEATEVGLGRTEAFPRGAQKEQRHRRRHGIRLQQVRQLDAVHARHVQVEHADVKGLPCLGGGSRNRYRFKPVGGLDAFDAPREQLLAQDRAIRGVVVDDQRAAWQGWAWPRRSHLTLTLARARESSNQNVEPSPGALTRPSLPPISSTSWRQMASPSPVPPNLRVVEESA